MKTTAPASVVQSVLRFTAAQGAAVLLLSLALSTWVWTDAASHNAIRISAWLAFGIQIVTFSICKLIARQNIMAGWGLGALLRFATLAMWGVLGIKALALPQSPALLSLATFLFVSTLIEPLFLNS